MEDRILVLNDMGGVQMDVSYDVTGTLRAQDHGHPPLVLIYDARGNGGGYCVSHHHGRSHGSRQ